MAAYQGCNQSSEDALLKVIILGDGGVGKSCLMNQFVNSSFDECYVCPPEVPYLEKKIQIEDQAYTLQIWDTPSQTASKNLQISDYRGSDICLLTYSIDNYESFEHLTDWRKKFLDYVDLKEDSAFPFVVVGNKVDIPIGKRKVSTEEVKAWCLTYGSLPSFDTSAKNATNVKQAFTFAVKKWAEQKGNLDTQGRVLRF